MNPMETTTPCHHNCGGTVGPDEDPCAMMDMMMSSTFHTGYCEIVLFDGWRITSVGALIGSMIGIICMAILYECIKYFREYLFTQRFDGLQTKGTVSVTSVTMEGLTTTNQVLVKPSMFSKSHTVQTLLHAVQVILSYLLMLIFMTYNVWLCLAVIIGAVLGYFLVGWKKSAIVDITEHCQ